MCEICDNTFIFSNKQRIELNKSLNVDDIISKVLQQMFDNGKIDKKTFEYLFATHNAPLQNAVVEGYGKTLSKIEYNSPNYEFLKQLQTNTAVFAMFKNHASIKEMAALLKDADGNVRSKADFIKEAKKVDENYRTKYLDVEYDTAVRQARMASQWQKIQKNKHLYPNLKYLLTKAAKPDKNHLAYVGIIAPVDSAFWNTNYPPNRWRCQCGVEQTDEGTTDIPNDLPPVPADFAFNSGKLGQVFDVSKTEYYKSATPLEAMQLIKNAKNLINKDIAATLDYQTIATKNGKLEVHPLAFNNGDFDEVFEFGKELAKNYTNLKVLPEVFDLELRKILPKGVKGASNPDYLISDKYVTDLKTVSKNTKKAVAEAVSRCNKQCNNIILKIDDKNDISNEFLKNLVKGKLTHDDYKDFNNVWIHRNGILYKTNRKEIIEGKWPIKAK